MRDDRSNVFRAHVNLRVEWPTDAASKLERLRELVAEEAGAGTTLVFVNQAGTAEQLQRNLAGLKAVRVLHKLPSAADRCSDGRLVVQLELPATLEAYHRQLAEAGRDDAPARAVLLCSQDDAALHRRHRSPAQEHMVGYCYTHACRWKLLLDHFDEDAAFTRCGICDNCERLDALTEEAVKGHQPLPAVSPPAASEHAETPSELHHAPFSTALRPGTPVAVSRHGWGWIQQLDEALIAVEFPDGHTGQFTLAQVHPLSQHALEFVARLLPGQVSALLRHQNEEHDNALTYHQMLGLGDPPASGVRPVQGPLLGPSDSSDSGSDLAGWAGESGELAEGDSSDAGGTGEGWSAGAAYSHEAFDIRPDRIVDDPDVPDGHGDITDHPTPMREVPPARYRGLT